MLTITDMVMVCNFEVVCNKYNVIEMSVSGNHTQDGTLSCEIITCQFLLA
jgi:hypothetical protein